MHLKKTLILFILVALPGTMVAQMRAGNYQSLKTGKEKTVETFPVKVVPLGNGVMHFHEGDPRKPLTGTYRITVSRWEYSTGNFKKGIVDGDWEEYYNDWLRQKSFYRNGLLEGKLVRYKQNGEEESVYTYKNGLKQHYISYHPGGRIREELFYDEDGRLHGEMFSYDTNGNIEEEKRYRHGQRHSKQVNTNKDGYKISQEYVDNKKQGEYTKSYPNGVLAEKGTYDEKGEKTGRWMAWNDDGSMKTEENYLDGKLHGEKRVYYAGDKLKSSEQYAGGELHGPIIEYDEDPYRVSREMVYSKRNLHGPFKVWHEGILWREGAYQDGKLIYEKEYTDGKLQIVKLLDENGTLIPVEKYDKAGKRTYRNKDYRKHSSVILKESSGVVDVEIN